MTTPTPTAPPTAPPTANIVMQDSTTPDSIPADAQAIAGYVNGAKSEWPANAWGRFTTKYVRHIDVLAAGVGDVLDVETGDATPGEARGWLEEYWANPRSEWWPALYCNKSTWAEMGEQVKGVNFVLWLADPTSIPHIIPGSQATQYAWDGTNNIDYSVTEPAFWQGRAAPTTPATSPTTSIPTQIPTQIPTSPTTAIPTSVPTSIPTAIPSETPTSTLPFSGLVVEVETVRDGYSGVTGRAKYHPQKVMLTATPEQWAVLMAALQ
jgi:hypothetical protein